MNQDEALQAAPVETPWQVRRLTLERPTAWLRLGWQDLCRHPGPSLAHGVLVTAMGWVVLALASTHLYLVAAAVSGFLLVGPILATGLCELSRRDDRGELADFDDSLDALGRNPAALWQFAFVLLGFSLLWFSLSGLILHAMIGVGTPTLGEITWGTIVAMGQPQAFGFYLGTGAILAFLVFILSVVAVPAIIDDRISISAITAMHMSLQAVLLNLPLMLIWAGLIVVLTAMAYLTLLVGMIGIYPLLGHATWHAYRELVETG